MGVIRDAFVSAWREFSTPGVPSTGERKPSKKEIFGVGDIVEGQVNNLRSTIDEEVARLEDEIGGIASSVSTGAKWVAPVALAATGNVATLSGEQTIDGQMTSTSRVLLPHQNTPSQNGVWNTSPGAWTRATDADAAAEMLGLAVSVNGGTVNGGKSFICQAVAPITIGTTALPFVEMLNQSAFTAAVNGLNADIASVDTRYAGLLGPAIRSQSVGAATPAAGTANASGGVYALNRAADFDGTLKRGALYTSVAGIIRYGVFTRSSSDVFTLVTYVDVSVPAGYSEAELNLPIKRGEYAGFVTPEGTIRRQTATNSGFFFAASLTGSSFTDTSVSSTEELQVRLDIEQLQQPQEGTLFAETKTLPQVLGVAATPITGSNLLPGTAILIDPAESDSLIDFIEWYTAGPVTCRVVIIQLIGGVWKVVKEIARLTTVPGVNRLVPPDILEEGQQIAFQSTVSGFVVYTAYDGTSWRYSSQTSGDTIDTPAPTLRTDVTPQARVQLRRIAGEHHQVSLANTPVTLLLSNSYGASHYAQKGQGWLPKVSQLSDHRFENFSYGGNSVPMLLSRMRADFVTGYAPLHPRKMPLGEVILMEGRNSASHPDNHIDFADYKEFLRETIETIQSLGATASLCSEWRVAYDVSAHAVYRAVAEVTGAQHLDLVPHTLRNMASTIDNRYFDSPAGDCHPGVRSNALIAAPMRRFLEQRGRPASSIKLFRKRDSITVADVNADLMFRDNYERAERFKEIALNQTSFTPETEKYFDDLGATGSYNPNVITQSEYLLLQLGGVISLGEYALLDIVIDAVRPNVERFQIHLSDPNVEVYVKDGLKAPYGDEGKSVSLWTQVIGSGGIFALYRKNLEGKMHGDKLTFLLHKAGGITISEPKIDWWGKAGKPERLATARPHATGAELLTKTKFTASDMNADPAAGWSAVGGTVTPQTGADYMLPDGITRYVTLDAATMVVQNLNYVQDNRYNIEAEVSVQAAWFPAPFASSGSYPGSSPITGDTLLCRKVVVELLDASGTYVSRQEQIVDSWWDDEIRFPITLPAGASPLKLRVSANDAVKFTEVSVKRY